MPNYKEVVVDGSRWQRCKTVTICNPLNKTAEVWFQEEEITVLGEEIIERDKGSIRLIFNPSTEIALLDTETNLPTGATITHGALYQALYSAYMSAATERDLNVAA